MSAVAPHISDMINAQNPTDQRSADDQQQGSYIPNKGDDWVLYLVSRVVLSQTRAAIAESPSEKQMTPIRIEAEDMTTTYRTESGSFASGGKLNLRTSRPHGASTAFTGEGRQLQRGAWLL